MTKVVINRCFGRFGLSPKATLRLYELGCTEIASPVDEYYGPGGRGENDLDKWREHLKSPGHEASFLTVFSPDETQVLYAHDVERTSPLLIQVVEEMGDTANSWAAKLDVVDIPDDVEWHIHEYDGLESVHENHRTW